jgi:RNA polymerase sigma-70 factor (ECF subfamily)
MLGSFDDCEDLVQETFLRAWRGRATFAGRSSLRAWLYKIATNACLDALDKRPRTPVSGEILWLQPYPDRLLDELPAAEDDPHAAVVEKETIEPRSSDSTTMPTLSIRLRATRPFLPIRKRCSS